MKKKYMIIVSAILVAVIGITVLVMAINQINSKTRQKLKEKHLHCICQN